LIAGRRYLFAVRAINAEGSSSEVLSDGVVVRADPCDACLVGQLCVAGVCQPDPCAMVMCGAGQTCQDGLCVMTSMVDGGVVTRPDAGMTDPPAAGGLLLGARRAALARGSCSCSRSSARVSGSAVGADRGA
jgi:hypothetical protein